MATKNLAMEEILDAVMDIVCNSENIAYCQNCPLKYYEADINYEDCPYGMDIPSCEYSPYSQIEADVDKIMLSIEACRP